MELAPTVGRAVHYYPMGYAHNATPLHATIAKVWNTTPTLLNIGFLDENGAQHSATSVPLLEPDQPLPKDDREAFCAWPPRT